MESAGLRQHLRDALASLQTRIQADGSKSLEAHRTQAHLAELSAVRSLLGLCLQALSGEIIQGRDGLFMSLGHIRDCHDATSTAARELSLMRQNAEMDLAKPSVAVSRPVVQLALQAVVDDENRSLAETEMVEKTHTDLLQQSVQTCSRELCDVLCSTLGRASDATSWEAASALGAAASLACKRLVAAWLTWFIAIEPVKGRPSRCALPAHVTLLCIQNCEVGAYVRILRECMHLRRQQARLVSVLRRPAGAVQVADACQVLRSQIVLPSDLVPSCGTPP